MSGDHEDVRDEQAAGAERGDPPSDAPAADDALRTRLRSADPAAVRPAPADASWTEDLARGVMTRPAATGPTGRRWLPSAAAAAAVAVVAATAYGVVAGDDDGRRGPENEAAPEVTLSVPAAPPGRCLPPSVRTLPNAESAFSGTATVVRGGEVVLEVDRWYEGGPADTVRLEVPQGERRRVVGAVDFRKGQRYLVAAAGGAVTLCGWSAPWSQEMADLYAAAFGG